MYYIYILYSGYYKDKIINYYKIEYYYIKYIIIYILYY